MLKPQGIRLAVHNHWWQFANKVGPRNKPGQYAYDVFMASAPSVFSELDVYWVAYGWADPVEVLSRTQAPDPVAPRQGWYLGGGVVAYRNRLRRAGYARDHQRS